MSGPVRIPKRSSSSNCMPSSDSTNTRLDFVLLKLLYSLSKPALITW